MMLRFTFPHEIERGEDIINIDVTYTVTPFRCATYWQPEEGGEVEIVDIFPNTCLSDAEEDAIYDAAVARCREDLAEEAAEYADWRYQQYRDRLLEREML
jgi:hypothetical protein